MILATSSGVPRRCIGICSTILSVPGERIAVSISPGTDKIVEQIPMQRLGTPDEVAKIIYVLCTETSSYVNGAEIHINGGQHV